MFPLSLFMKTTLAKNVQYKDKTWYVIDAKGQVLGRLAVQISNVLRGRHKPTYTPHVDTGDYVIVINADKVALSGTKKQTKMDYRHSGFPGGLRATFQPNSSTGGPGDRLHPNRAGYLAMGHAVDLDLLAPVPPPTAQLERDGR